MEEEMKAVIKILIFCVSHFPLHISCLYIYLLMDGMNFQYLFAFRICWVGNVTVWRGGGVTLRIFRTSQNLKSLNAFNVGPSPHFLLSFTRRSPYTLFHATNQN